MEPFSPSHFRRLRRACQVSQNEPVRSEERQHSLCGKNNLLPLSEEHLQLALCWHTAYRQALLGCRMTSMEECPLSTCSARTLLH